MSFAGLNTAQNYSFYAVPGAFALAFYAMALFNKERAPGTEPWDLIYPASNAQRLQDAKLSQTMADRYLRAEAAQNNGYVTLPFFAAAIVAGNVARLEPKLLNTVAAAFLVSRAIYNYIYIHNTTATSAKARTASWAVGIIASCTLFVQAGNKFVKGYASF